jgi:uncharacterized repeat protein (TIGR03803 family)
MNYLAGGKITFGMCVMFIAMTVDAQTFKKLADFAGTNGDNPYLMSLTQGTDGNLYGTTSGGGSNNEGTIFKISRNGKLTTVYNFCSQPRCADGALPESGLIQAVDGNFYGTTSVGGAIGYGTVFQFHPNGTLTTLHSFDLTDGEEPSGALVQASNGSFFGTTEYGGGPLGYGTVFEITSTGVLTSLLSFDYSNGAYPYDALIQGSNGDLFGTTSQGGFGGTVFKMTLSGALTTLADFDGGLTGIAPIAGLIQASDGDFFGTTMAGGEGSQCSGGCGTIFSMTPTGTLKVLASFGQSGSANPSAGLIEATDGNFYGTTSSGWSKLGYGTIFQFGSGKITTLHSFAYLDGSIPTGGLTQSTDGNFYGTTFQGGTKNLGTVFKFSLGLQPFISFLRDAARIGGVMGILGQSLTGATSVSINGTPASFTVISDTFIKATVPYGATTGYVTVTTPSGVLTSNVPFHVIP